MRVWTVAADAPTPRRLLSEARRRRRVISADNNTYAGAWSRYGRARSYDLWIAPPYDYHLFKTHTTRCGQNRTFGTRIHNERTYGPASVFWRVFDFTLRRQLQKTKSFRRGEDCVYLAKRSARKLFDSSREGVVLGQGLTNSRRFVESKKEKKNQPYAL